MSDEHDAEYSETDDGFFNVWCACGFSVVRDARLTAGWAADDHMNEAEQARIQSGVPWVEVDQETAYGITTRMRRSIRVF